MDSYKMQKKTLQAVNLQTCEWIYHKSHRLSFGKASYSFSQIYR